METSLILLVIVEIGAVEYMMSRQVCKRTNTLIKEEHSNSGAMRHAMRTKTRIDSRGSCGKQQLKTTVTTSLRVIYRDKLYSLESRTRWNGS